MKTYTRGPSGNRLIDLLPRSDRERLLAHGASVEFGDEEMLARPEAKIRQVYFPIDSIISITVSQDAHTGFEVRPIGSEGMLGIALVLGVDRAAMCARVRAPGRAWRFSSIEFLRICEGCGPLQAALNRYAVYVLGQIGRAATCNRFHLLEGRLPRWLLTTQDRIGGPDVYVTHEELAHMLGVRRVGITRAATSLQNLGLISYRRGHVTIVDRMGLVAESCACYQADVADYARIVRAASGDGEQRR